MDSGPDDPFNLADARYNEAPLNPQRTKEIEELAAKPAAEGDAAAKALEAILELCAYLNRWNRVGKSGVEAAEKEIAAALKINPNLAAAHYARGFVFRTQGDHHNALAAFQKAVEIEPDNARFIAQAGAELLYLGDADGALKAVERALEVNPNSPARGMFLWIAARAHFFSGRYAEAIGLLEQSVQTWPDLWYTQAYRVSACALIGDRTKASQELANFIARFPDLNTIERIVEAERTNPNNNRFVVEGRCKFHEGLAIAGMPLEV